MSSPGWRHCACRRRAVPQGKATLLALAGTLSLGWFPQCPSATLRRLPWVRFCEPPVGSLHVHPPGGPGTPTRQLQLEERALASAELITHADHTAM